jgi:hypothetical protein
MKNEQKCNNDIDIYSFDCKQYLNIFESYTDNINCLKLEIRQIIDKRNKDQIKEDAPECIKMKNNINALKHNLNYNIDKLKYISKYLTNINLDLVSNLESLCDHEMDSECQYHNDRYYFCKKCSYEP